MSKKILLVLGLIVVIFTTAVVLPKISALKGRQCYKKGDIACAVDNFNMARILAPSSLEYEYYYTKALTRLKPGYKMEKELVLLSKNAKSKSAKKLAKSTISQIRTGIINNTGNNYIEQATSDADIVRWNKESFPLNVYIRQQTNVPDYYNSAIKRAMALWAKSVSFIDFKHTNNPSNAQILIEIKPLPSNACVNGVCKYITGYTTPVRSGKQLKSMAIVLYDKDPSGAYFTDKEIFHTISHELGHALGIMGHSYSSDDLMYSTQKNTNTIYDKYKADIPTLSGKDVNTIELLYKLEPTVTDRHSNNSNLIYAPVVLGSRDDILDRKIKEAKSYIQSAPGISTGYIDLSSAYLQKGNPKAAEDTLLKGLNFAKSNEEVYIIYYNLSLVCCTSRQFSKAKNYLNKAKQINNSPEIAELEYMINNKIVPSL